MGAICSRALGSIVVYSLYVVASIVCGGFVFGPCFCGVGPVFHFTFSRREKSGYFTLRRYIFQKLLLA